MTTKQPMLREAAEKALTWFEWFHKGNSVESPASSIQCSADLRAALAAEQKAEPIGINGLTHDEESQTASVMGIVNRAAGSQATDPGRERAELICKLRYEVVAMRNAVAGKYTEGTFHALNWADKPHRVVYDACFLLEEVISVLEADAQRPALRPLTDGQRDLCSFYGVLDLDSLVEAQAHHIEKMQSKLPPLRDEQSQKPRNA